MGANPNAGPCDVPKDAANTAAYHIVRVLGQVRLPSWTTLITVDSQGYVSESGIALSQAPESQAPASEKC